LRAKARSIEAFPGIGESHVSVTTWNGVVSRTLTGQDPL
jgi:hypothetical protein